MSESWFGRDVREWIGYWVKMGLRPLPHGVETCGLISV